MRKKKQLKIPIIDDGSTHPGGPSDGLGTMAKDSDQLKSDAGEFRSDHHVSLLERMDYMETQLKHNEKELEVHREQLSALNDKVDNLEKHFGDSARDTSYIFATEVEGYLGSIDERIREL